MENTSTSTGITEGGVTVVERHLQFIIYASCSFIALLGNFFVAIGIARSKKLRSRFYVTLVFVLLCRLLMCLQLLGLSIYRILIILKAIAPGSRLVCAILGIVNFPGTLELLLLIDLAIDRAMALFAINWYRRLTWRHAVVTCVTLAMILFLTKVFLLLGEPSLESRVSCMSIFDGIAAQYVVISQYADLTLLVFLLVLYLCILAAVRSRLVRFRETFNDDEASMSLQRQMALMPTLRCAVLIHCIWTLSAKVLLSLGIMPFGESYSARCTMYGGIIVASELLINVLLLLWTDEDVRKATLACCRKQKVGPVAPYYPG